MPTARLDQDVFAAGGTVATDWAQAGGNAQVSVAAGAQVRRGLNLDLGIQALASVDASVGNFFSAEVSGQASASASVTAQIQAPMNLFQEIGFAVRLQAIAELAAAVQVGLGLKIGDFLERVTEPALRPIRSFIPNLGGIDISPIVLILLLAFIQQILARLYVSLSY